jgi:hypothetical protein
MKKSSDRTERGQEGSEMPQTFGVLQTDQPMQVETIPEYFASINCCYIIIIIIITIKIQITIKST